MRFEAVFPARQTPNGALAYRANEYSFAFEPLAGEYTTVLINDLSLEVNADGRVVSVWGYCPYMSWKAASLDAPQAKLGDVIFIPDAPLIRGVSLRPYAERWPIYFDRNSGWVNFDSGREGLTVVQVLPGVILELDAAGDLCDVWLKPDALPAKLL